MKKRVKFFKEADENVLVLIPTFAITREGSLKSIQFYFLSLRLAIIWGDI